MAFFDEYYRAYRDFRNAVSPLPEYEKRVSGIRRADPGTDRHNGSVRLCVIDMDWVEAMEKALPSIDRAIRENRRFISQEEEIVPIEKSRRITTESVRHLAQHTNMISRVDGDEVTPERILNVRREESFAIYENRFLVLLIETALRFIEKRFSAMRSQTDRTLSHVFMNRDFGLENEVVRFSLDYCAEYRESEKFDVNADISTMTDFARVQRVRAILSSYAATPLIRGLKGVDPVRPPIARTNLLQKNPYFRDCLELWTYLETYTKDGFHVELSESEGEMEPLLQENMEAAMDMMSFVVRSMSNEKTAAKLEQQYLEENARRAEEAERLERERKAAEDARLIAAVESERSAQEEKQRILWEEFLEEKRALREESEAKLRALKEEAEAKQQALKEESEAKQQALQEEFEARQTAQKEYYENQYSETVSDYEARFSSQQKANEAEKAGIISSWSAELENEKEKAAAAMEELRRSNAAERSELAERAARMESELASVTRRLETERSTARRHEDEHDREMQRLKARMDRTAQSAQAKLERAEKRSARKIRLLEMRLEKALARCPYAEVMAVKEEDI